MGYDDEYGPPSWEDDAWFLEHVIAAGHPKVKREPRQLPGQTTLYDFGQEQPDLITRNAIVIEPRPDGFYLNGKPVE